MALYNDETSGISLQKVFNRIGIRRNLNLGDLSNTNTSLSNLLNGLVKGDENTFIADDLNAIKNIFSNGLTNSGYRNVIGSASIFTNVEGQTNFFDPRITYQNRLDTTEVFTGNPRFLGGNGLTANYFQNDQILFDEHANFEYNVDPNTTEAEVFGGETVDGQIPSDNFWEEGDFEYSAKVHPQSSKINTGVKWEGYFVPRRTGPVRFRIRCTGYFTFDFNQEGYEEDDDKNEKNASKNRVDGSGNPIGVGKTYTEHMRIGISTSISGISGSANAIVVSGAANLEKMNTIGIGMTVVLPSKIATGSKVFDFDKSTGKIELTPPEGTVSAVTGTLDGTETVQFTRHLGDEIEHSMETHVLEEYKKTRIRISYFHHKNFDSKDIDRIFNIDIKEMDIATHQNLRYNRLFSLNYDFSDKAKGEFNRYYDSSVRFGGTGSLDSPTIGSTINSNKYVKLTTTSKIVVEYIPPKKLDDIVIKTFQVTNNQGNYAPSNRAVGSKGVIVTAESPILTLRTTESTQNVEIGNLIVSTQATGDDQGGQGSQGGDGEPSIPFFARVKDFVINNYIVMDMNALRATGNNAGIGVTNAAQVKIIDHRGLVRRVRVNASSNNTITSSVPSNPFTGTQSANSSSQTAYKDVQKGMIVIGENIPDYTVVDEVNSKTELKLSAPVTVSANQDVFFYDSKGLRDNSTLDYCDRFNTTASGPDVRCLIAKVKDSDGNPIPGGHQPETTSFEVEDDNGVEIGWTLQGIYFGDSGTAVSNINVGTSSTTITIPSPGITAPLLDGTRFTAVNITGSPDRTLCCPPTDTSPPFRATAEGLNTVKNEYENLKIDGGNLVFESLILQDNVNNNNIPNNTSVLTGNQPTTAVANRKIKIKSTTENKSYHMLAVE